MKGGEIVISSIDLASSFRFSKADDKSKAAGFPETSPDKSCSFRDSLKQAERNISQYEAKTDEIKVQRKEQFGKSETKLKVSSKDNDGDVNESSSKKTIKKGMTIDEIMSILEELAKLQQAGSIPTGEHIALLEDLKEALNALSEIQIKGEGLEGVSLQTKIANLGKTLEEMLKELKFDGSLKDEKIGSDFLQKLKAVIDGTAKSLGKEETDFSAVESAKGNNAVKIEAEAANTKEKAETESKAQAVQIQSKDTERTAVSSEPQIKQTQPDTEEGIEEVKTALDSKVDKVTVEEKDGRKQDTKSNSGNEAPKGTIKAADPTQKKVVNEEMLAVKFDQTLRDSNVEEAQKAAAVPRAQILNKADVISQIVKKAEIIITDAKPEMRMQLEPENLGKLTLQVAVERGLITAKFVAESYEVKQIIESSFNELKDMLQEKGLDVQNFSVSVGQDNKQYNNGNAFHQWKETVRLNGRSMRGGYDGYLEGDGAAPKVINPYSYHNGEFDHRA